MRADGAPIKALNPLSTWLPVGAPVQGGEQVEIYVEAASNPDIHGAGVGSPLGDLLTAGNEPLYRVRRVELAVFERAVWELVQDIEVLDQLMRQLSVEDPRRWQILRALELAMDALDPTDLAGSAAAAREVLAPVLAAPAHSSAHVASAIGHAHIDSAWLWPLRETVRKVARTISNVTALMDEHPDLVFAMSSAQQWAWMKEHRPEVWARMREKVATGQLVPVGGMWVESDTNMPGGEALARQLVHGKRFFLDELDIETEEVWLPDSFGYTAALPQLVALSGSRWFLTQKISWNQTNRHPHHTFWWEGIDGTRVFTHFPPVDTYNSELSGEEMAHLVANFSEKGVANRSMVPFGHGDGGGGPTREMLARATRLSDLEGSARVEIEAPSAFFAKALEDHAAPAVWVGELYLELHRATYTTQADTKQGNRRSEHLLREAELWATTASVRTAPPTRPPTSTACGRPCCCTSSTTSCPAPRSPGCIARRGTPTPRSPASSRTSSPPRSRRSPAMPARRAGWSSTRPHTPGTACRRVEQWWRPQRPRVRRLRWSRRAATSSTTVWCARSSTSAVC